MRIKSLSSTSLSALYKPSEVEELLDRRDRLHSRLYARLIPSLLGAPLPAPDRETFHTLATLHRCSLCGMFLTREEGPMSSERNQLK